MKKLEKFEGNKLEKKEFYPIVGGKQSLSDATNTNGNVTRSTGGDADNATSDADDDPNGN